MIRSTAIKTSFMRRFSPTFVSWVRGRRSCLRRLTWRMWKRTGWWCSRKGLQRYNAGSYSLPILFNRFYWILYLVLFVLLPINAPLEYWDDSVQAAIFVAFSLRYIIVINIAWLINAAHFIWGLDKNHKQSDSNMVFIVTKRWMKFSDLSEVA